MIKKRYFTYNEIHKTVAKVSDEILHSNFQPDVIVAIGSGGFVPALILRTFISKPVFAVTLSYYDKNNQPNPNVTKLQWINEIDDKIRGQRVLLVDEIDDSRVTLAYCVTELLLHHPKEVAVCVLHSKIKRKKGVFPKEVKHFFVGESLADEWLVYPWDAHDIESHDNEAKKSNNG